MIKTILITGATGFLGSHLVKALFDSGYDIVVLKRSFSNIWRIKDVLNELIFYDIDKTALEVPFKENKIDCVIHTATLYGRQGEKASEIAEANLIFPLKLLEIAVSFNTDTFFNTDTILYKSLNYYSLSKRQFVEWLKPFHDQIKIFNLKLEHMYGEGDDFSKFIPFVIRELLLKAKEIRLTKGEQKRDFIYVEDVVNAFVNIISQSDKFSKGFYEYQIGSGIASSIKDIVVLLKSLTQNEETYLNFGALPYRENEIMESRANIVKIKKDIGWEPKIPLKDGLKRTVCWYRSSIGKEEDV
jgi:nucleoside-diphosphate-sugar epimerase